MRGFNSILQMTNLYGSQCLSIPTNRKSRWKADEWQIHHNYRCWPTPSSKSRKPPRGMLSLRKTCTGSSYTEKTSYYSYSLPCWDHGLGQLWNHLAQQKHRCVLDGRHLLRPTAGCRLRVLGGWALIRSFSARTVAVCHGFQCLAANLCHRHPFRLEKGWDELEAIKLHWGAGNCTFPCVIKWGSASN